GQVVVVEVQRLQLGELAKPLWQCGYSVVAEVQRLQLGELTQRLRQLSQFRRLLIPFAAEIEFRCPRLPRFFNLLLRFSISRVTCHRRHLSLFCRAGQHQIDASSSTDAPGCSDFSASSALGTRGLRSSYLLVLAARINTPRSKVARFC